MAKSLMSLLRHLHMAGVKIAAGSSLELHRSLQALKGQCTPDGVEMQPVVAAIATRAMKLAQYFCTFEQEAALWHHYALNVDHYTHFTSPIRRYADVIVHRLLQLAIWKDFAGAPPAAAAEAEYRAAVSASLMRSIRPERIMAIAEQCNFRKVAATKAQEQSARAYFIRLLTTKGPMTVAAAITNMGDGWVEAYVPTLGLEVRLERKTVPYAVYFDGEQSRVYVDFETPVERNGSGKSVGVERLLRGEVRGESAGRGRRGKQVAVERREASDAEDAESKENKTHAEAGPSAAAESAKVRAEERSKILKRMTELRVFSRIVVQLVPKLTPRIDILAILRNLNAPTQA
jgi:hypothetical protein